MLKSIRLICLSLLLAAGTALAGPVNVNTADAETLAHELDGVGMTRAEAIVKYREEHGPFRSIEELLAVKGIGEAILAKNKDNILLTDE